MTTAAAPSRTALRARWFHFATFAVGVVALVLQTILVIAESDPAAQRGMSSAIRLWNLVSYGEARDWYPYPFIDVGEIGYGQAIVNVLGVTALLVLVGQIYVFLDRRLSPTPR